MLRLTLAALLLLLLLPATAQDLMLPLWPAGRVPNWRDAGERERRDSTDAVRIFSVQVPAIEVYLPTKKAATGQAVVICPGGGYGYLAYNWEGSDPARLLSARGITAVVLKYRLPVSKSNLVGHRSPLLDAQRALRLVRAHAARWNLRPDAIGIMGFSAGGHLAATAATHFDGEGPGVDSIDRLNSRPDFQVLLYPVITLTAPVRHSGSRRNLLGEPADTALARYYSAELHVGTHTPPAFLVHAGDDAGVPAVNSLLYYAALQEHRVPAELHLYPAGGHGFSLATGRGYLETWPNRLLDWLKTINRR